MKEYNITYTDTFISINKELVLKWVAQNIGFGELCLRFDKNSGKVCIDSERMGRDFVKAALNKMVDNSVFVDLEKLTKTTNPLTLEEANSLFSFKDHIILLPFYIEQDAELTQYRWHLSNNNVINVWLAGKEENIFSLSQNIQKNKTFPKNFKKAELWKWNIEDK